MDKDVLTPAMLDGGFQVPFSGGLIFDSIQKPCVVSPRQLCNNLLHN